MSRLFRDRSRGGSRRQGLNPIPLNTASTSTVTAATSTSTAATSMTLPVYPIDGIPSPFGDLGLQLSDSELRVTAYEILIGSCRSTGGKPLTYISQSERSIDRSSSLSSAPSLHKSLTSTAASKFKKTLGLKSKRGTGSDDSVSQGRVRSGLTVGELIRIQMRISEQIDSRIRRALLRINAGQLGKRMESMVLPLELFQQLKALDFQNNEELMAWQKRYLKVLEIGLLLHPHMPIDKTDNAPQRFRQIARGAKEKPVDAGKNFDTMQDLRSIVMSLSCRSSDGTVPSICHWADVFPLNLRLYQMLLEACFDANEPTSIIEEIDEVLEHFKKTWVVLGINEMLHNLCLSWVLFNRYVATGQVASDLLFASTSLLAEVENDFESFKGPDYSNILNSTLNSILVWVEKKLLAYRDDFHSDNIECMQNIVSIAMLAFKLLQNGLPYNQVERKKKVEPCDRVDNYIRSSLRAAFSKRMESLKSSKHLSKNQKSPLPVLCVLAQDVSELAFDEKAMFSPILKEWHPHAAGVAVSTLHSCYGKELKNFILGIAELTPDAIEVLKAADKLEKDLVQIAVADSVNSDDGGKSVIQEMPPYEAEAVIGNLVRLWIDTRVDRLKEWIDRFLQQEVWNPRANKEHIAPSVVEILRIVDESLEAFFLLPIPQHALLLPNLITGLDKCLHLYILKAKSDCGSRSTYVPSLPSLTRCSKGSKFDVFKKKEKLQSIHGRKTHVGITNVDNSLSIPQLCVFINSLHHIRTELEVQKRRSVNHLRNLESIYPDAVKSQIEEWFSLSTSSCVEGMRQLCEVTAYKVVYYDLNQFLLDGLYVGEVASSRIEPFLQELEQYLETISTTVHDRVRTRVITDLMKASFDGFLLVLLAGGPSRSFIKQDTELIEEDFKFLTDLFWSNGDGLPADLICKYSGKVKGVLDLFHLDSETLIQQFKGAMAELHGNSAKSKLPLPPSSNWDPTEPDTVLRVLCYRNDELAMKFLKKTYNLPKKL